MDGGPPADQPDPFQPKHSRRTGRPGSTARGEAQVELRRDVRRRLDQFLRQDLGGELLALGGQVLLQAAQTVEPVRSARFADEGAAPGLLADEPVVLQQLQRLAQRGQCDPVGSTQLALRGQGLARCVDAVTNRRGQVGGDRAVLRLA